jgi:hypothetical protein
LTGDRFSRSIAEKQRKWRKNSKMKIKRGELSGLIDKNLKKEEKIE